MTDWFAPGAVFRRRFASETNSAGQFERSNDRFSGDDDRYALRSRSCRFILRAIPRAGPDRPTVGTPTHLPL